MNIVKQKRPSFGSCECGNNRSSNSDSCGCSNNDNSSSDNCGCCSNEKQKYKLLINKTPGVSRRNTQKRIKSIKSSSPCGCGCTNSISSESEISHDKIQMKYSDGSIWVTGTIPTSAGPVQQISTSLTFSDILGSIKARLGINRNHYKVEPGLYCVGTPDNNSIVLVTANYKMTFDSLRSELSGLNAWLLVLDTNGINVWCAAGKGTFGTKELVHRIALVKLSSIVSHRNIILPQLGASGIAAHKVLKQSCFRVTYGPVRANDLKAFINNNMKADTEMRKVKFTFVDRLVLTPLELITTLKTALIIFGVMFLLNSLNISNFGVNDVFALLGAIFAGTVLAPALLPFIPGRAFSFKGGLLGLLWAFCINIINGFPSTPSYGWLLASSYFLILPATSAYLAMNFTGCSTYTSFSGVKREMQVALPLIVISFGMGMIMWLVDLVIRITV